MFQLLSYLQKPDAQVRRKALKALNRFVYIQIFKLDLLFMFVFFWVQWVQISTHQSVRLTVIEYCRWFLAHRESGKKL